MLILKLFLHLRKFDSSLGSGADFSKSGVLLTHMKGDSGLNGSHSYLLMAIFLKH